MTPTTPCPRCQKPLEIPQPPLDQMRCLNCGAVINRKKKATPAETAPAISAAPPAVQPTPQQSPPAPPPTAAMAPRPDGIPYRIPILLGMLGVPLFGCLAFAGIGLVLWIFGGEEKKAGPDDPAAKKVAAEKPVEPKEPALPPKIQAAVDRGVAHLKKRLHEKGEMFYALDEKGNKSNIHDKGIDDWFLQDRDAGATALAGLALLEAQVPPHDPAIQNALAAVRQAGPKMRMVYSIGTVLFFLNRLHEAEPLNSADRELVRSLALRLVAGQATHGRWHYDCPPITPKVEQDLLQELHANKYQPKGTAPHYTNSLTQFALLGLWVSRRHDVPVRPALLAAAASFHKTQNPDGSWHYGSGYQTWQSTDTCTAAGLITLAMEKTLREEKAFQVQTAGDPPANPKADEQAARAFTYLAKAIGRPKDEKNTGVKSNIIPVNGNGGLYFLWCLERVAVIYDLKIIDGKDWYEWGSEVILKNQKEDGSWREHYGDVCDTSFALLFLTRANLAKDVTEIIRSRRLGKMD